MPDSSPAKPPASETAAASIRRVVITGGSSGIGRATAIAIASQPLGDDDSDRRMVVSYRTNHEGALRTVEQIRSLGWVCDALPLDLSLPPSVSDFASAAVDTLGQIDTWVNNAGADVLTGAEAEWGFEAKLRYLMDIDVIGTTSLSRIIGPQLVQWHREGKLAQPASMVFIGWDQATVGMNGDPGMMFGPVKAAVTSFALAMAQTYAPDLRVNVVAPGWIQTEWGESADGYWDDRARGQALMGRWGYPQDVAQAIAYLSDPANSFVTGQVLEVNGGWNRRGWLPHPRDLS